MKSLLLAVIFSFFNQSLFASSTNQSKDKIQYSKKLKKNPCDQSEELSREEILNCYGKVIKSINYLDKRKMEFEILYFKNDGNRKYIRIVIDKKKNFACMYGSSEELKAPSDWKKELCYPCTDENGKDSEEACGL